MKSDEDFGPSDYLGMIECIYYDASVKCAADVSDLRDLITIRSRVKFEGMSFLTITLPQFCTDFERSLELGFIDTTLFRSFKKSGAIPAFLQGMLCHIFDRETGRIYDVEKPNYSSLIPPIVACIRQICLACKKLELPCTPERESAALDNFIAIERSFEMFSLPREDKSDFVSVSSVLWDNIMGDLRLDQCTPRHGPGATAESISGNQKFVWRSWHERLEPFFPFYSCAYPIGLTSMIGARFETELDLVTFHALDEEQPVRVALVPKTLKSPRIIAIEPCCMQYTQQGIRDVLYDIIESHWLTRGHINFRDQSINQSLAMNSSKDGQLATIDLKDASDRVPRDLALLMFSANPDLRDAVDACRSTSALLPDGRIISPLMKFASMGSALCFPVEAMYFYTICVVALLRIRNLPVSHRNVFLCSRDVYVYGDDIVVPRDVAAFVLETLAKYNCKVNSSKTFFNGYFRESCGTDAFYGHRVTPVYLRKLFPKNRQQSSSIVSNVATANLFYEQGFVRSALYLFRMVEKVTGPLPSVRSDSASIGRNFPWYTTVPKRYNRDTQCLEEKHWVATPVYRTDELENFSALAKSLLRLHLSSSDDIDNVDPLSLLRSALHGAVTLKRRWVQPASGWFSLK